MRTSLARKTLLGIVQIAPLLVIALLIAGILAFATRNSPLPNFQTVLKSESDGSSSRTSSSDDDEDDEDETEDEDEEEFDELEFEEAEEEELEEATLAGERRRIEIRIKNGRRIVKIETVVNGVEREEEIEIREGEGIAVLKVEQGGSEQKVRIRLENGQFVIDQEGEGLAATTLPVSIDSETKTITVETSLGPINLGQLPGSIFGQVLAAGNMDTVSSIQLEENEDGDSPEVRLIYRVNGFRDERFLGLIRVTVENTAVVSAQTGEILSVEAPLLSRILDLLSF